MSATSVEAMPGDRVAGAILIAAGLLIPFAMLHHPTHLDAALVSEVHGVMIGLLLASAYGFAHLAIRLGLPRPPVLGGAVLYAASVIANMLAATINGLAAPRLAGEGVAHEQLTVLFGLNEALAELAAVTAGAALVLWGTAWWSSSGKLARIVAVGGMLAGAVPALLLLAGAIRMDVHGALFAYAAQSLWGALAGWGLLSGSLHRDRPAGD